MLPQWLKKGFLAIFQPVVGWFVALNVKPNWLTTAGFVFSVGAAALFAGGRFCWGGLAAFASAVCDAIDGSLARRSNTVTTFGRFYDSFLDRYSELAIFIGLSFHYSRRDMVLHEVLVNLSLVGSLMVSYARARAEGLGLDCKVGLMERPERLTVIIAGALLTSIFGALLPGWDSHVIFTAGLWLLAVLTNVTAVQRMLHVRKVTKGAATPT
ncbi:MAG: CDP-alcohol phosphatidyltransferase family protein [Candidatus Edwardsbacteria bacterium]|jgi:CDP-diacylglycerol--glycerol-3-phosphate 3-phosphatidyltransferase|nr:CDP-alcohol phosphatidyltransferase family protein [Candidatus Edwardsbacteria bacterium]